MEFLKKYWFLITFVVAPLLTGIAFLFSLKSRIFETPEEKVSVVKFVEESPSPEQQQRAYFMDSLNKVSAIKTREVRLKKELERDSIRAIQDSIIMDYVQKNADQVFQIKEELKNRR